MPKFLIQASYTAEGLKGLMHDKASGRKAAVEKAFASVGGKVDSFLYSFGEYDAVLIVDVPDNTAAASLSLAVSASGLVRTRTTPLLTIEETDKALEKAVSYPVPGRA
jgi:uncharacterized protein with GYD domain